MSWSSFQSAKILHLVFTILLTFGGIALNLVYWILGNYGVLSIIQWNTIRLFYLWFGISSGILVLLCSSFGLTLFMH